MQLLEQHVIKRGDPRYGVIDEAAFASKNLWNAANYLVRQSFIHQGFYLDYVRVFHQIKSHEAYQGLPRKVSNQVLLQLHKAWVAFFEAMEAWKEHPERFTGRPKLLFDPTREVEPRFSGRRDGRWYRASGNRLIHADINGSYNIARKVIPTAFEGLGIAAPAVRPSRLAVKTRLMSSVVMS
jgi:transposase